MDDPRPTTTPLTGAVEGTVPLIAGPVADSTDAAPTVDDAGTLDIPSTNAVGSTVPPVVDAADDVGAPDTPPTDTRGKTMPLVAGAAESTVADAAPIDDVGASTISFDDTAWETLWPVSASAAGAVGANTTAVGSVCGGSSEGENIVPPPPDTIWSSSH